MARKMKDSCVEWIGEIPEGWKVIPAKFLFKNSDIRRIADDEQLTASQQFGIISQKDYTELTGSKVVLANKGLEDWKHVEPFDFIISLRSFQGGLEMSEITGCITWHYIVLKSCHKICSYYYKWLFKSDSYIRALQRTCSFIRDGQDLRYSNFIQVPLFEPPLAEQEKIANYLNAECSRIDAMLTKTRASIEEYKKLKQAVITQVVTKGVLGEREMKYSGVEWIGEVPSEWEVTRLKYLADFEPPCDTKHLTDTSEITYTPMECVKNGTFENRSALYGSLSHTLTPFQNSDIVMAKVTPCFENGNIAIMNHLFSGFGLGSSELFVFRAKKIFTSYFFYWLRNKTFVERACATMTGTGGLKRISPAFIRNCPVHCPPLAEQQEIADYLDAKCAEIDRLIEKKEQLVKELEGYKKSLIYEVVTGKREV